ncbi:unnamed protein product, partial [Didymodactylos carnosus]
NQKNLSQTEEREILILIDGVGLTEEKIKILKSRSKTKLTQLYQIVRRVDDCAQDMNLCQSIEKLHSSNQDNDIDESTIKKLEASCQKLRALSEYLDDQQSEDGSESYCDTDLDELYVDPFDSRYTSSEAGEEDEEEGFSKTNSQSITSVITIGTVRKHYFHGQRMRDFGCYLQNESQRFIESVTKRIQSNTEKTLKKSSVLDILGFRVIYVFYGILGIYVIHGILGNCVIHGILDIYVICVIHGFYGILGISDESSSKIISSESCRAV